MSPDRARRMAAGLVSLYLGERLAQANELPGLREATIEIAAAKFADDSFEQSMRAQLDQLRGPSSQGMPDAYLADELILENALQEAAAGLRVAAAAAGAILPAAAFEQEVADGLIDDPRMAIRVEAARVTRPTTRPVHLAWSLAAAPWANPKQGKASDWSPSTAQEAAEANGRTLGIDALARVDSGDHTGWVQIALMERQATPPVRYPAAPARQLTVSSSMLAGAPSVGVPRPPLSITPWEIWTTPGLKWPIEADGPRARAMLRRRGIALAGLVRTESSEPRGLGLAPVLLAPIGAIVVALGLGPDPTSMSLRLSDQGGPGLIGRVWRGALVHDGTYSPLLPAVYGADLLLRPDLFEELVEIVQPSRARVGTFVRWRQGGE